MGAFDIAIGFNGEAFNDAVKALYAKPQARSQLFSGHIRGQVMEADYDISWDISVLPIARLKAPSPEAWLESYGPDGKQITIPMPDKDIFQCVFKEITLTINEDDPFKIDGLILYCALEVLADVNALRITPLALNETDSSMKDLTRIFFNALALPKVFEQIRKATQKLDLPPHSQHIFGTDLTFETPKLLLSDERLILTTSEKGNALDIANTQFPSDQKLFILGKPEFILKLAKTYINTLTDILKGKVSGSASGIPYGVDYDIGVESLTHSAQACTTITGELSIKLEGGATLAPGVCAVTAAT